MLFITQLNKLENDQKKFERIQLSTIESILTNKLSEDDNIFRRYTEDRLSEQYYCTKLEIVELFKKINSIKNAIQNKNSGCIPDLSSLKKELINISNDISNISTHAQLKLQELSNEEKNFAEDLRVYEEKMAFWCEPVINTNQSNMPKVFNNDNIPKEVKTFMDFVTNSNGHENGWLPSDHQLFLKYRKKLNDDELIDQLHRVLPDISESNIRKHIMWYDRYKVLKVKQQEAIKNWQDGKKLQEKIPDDDELLKTSVEITLRDYNRKKLKDNIQTWKDKIQQEKEKEKRINEKIMYKQKQMQKHKQVLNKFKKNEVKIWKSQKLKEEAERIKNQEILDNTEKSIRKSVANKMIKIYQIQDMEFIEKKRNRENVRSQSVSDISSSSSPSCLKRDPNRLFKPTQQWINRVNQQKIDQPMNRLCDIPKLGRPAWRKGLI